MVKLFQGNFEAIYRNELRGPVENSESTKYLKIIFSTQSRPKMAQIFKNLKKKSHFQNHVLATKMIVEIKKREQNEGKLFRFRPAPAKLSRDRFTPRYCVFFGENQNFRHFSLSPRSLLDLFRIIERSRGTNIA